MAFFCSQVSKTTWKCVNLTIDSMLQCVYSVVDHNWPQSVVRTKKWWSKSLQAAIGLLQFLLRNWNLRNLALHSGILPYKSLEIFCTCTVLLHGSIMLPPHQPRVFARLAHWHWWGEEGCSHASINTVIRNELPEAQKFVISLIFQVSPPLFSALDQKQHFFYVTVN